MDGSEGTVIINPDYEYSRQFIAIQESRDSQRKEQIGASHTNRNASLNGREIPVMANVRSREDVELAMRLGADGV
jgi:phosphoenolpyruvate-protein kinase (PTS system EI component)